MIVSGKWKIYHGSNNAKRFARDVQSSSSINLALCYRRPREVFATSLPLVINLIDETEPIDLAGL